jgi:hypothetical protein
MSVLLLILVFINEYLHPLKRVIRKRGLFVSSICVAALCTMLLTQLTPLAPTLSATPISMTVLSVTMFQWFLYICVVTLKKCFTLGEMCVISQAAAVVVHGASEYICQAVSVMKNEGASIGLTLDSIFQIRHHVIYIIYTFLQVWS